MNDVATPEAYGRLIEPTTLEIRRRLPGPIERVWAYLTDGELRRKWLAAGDMPASIGGNFELVWRNDELTKPAGARPPGFAAEHRIQSEITAWDPPRTLAFTFGGAGHVTFTLEPRGKDVLLTVIHRRLPDRSTKLKVSAGWHTHLDLLVAIASGGPAPAHFWDSWARLQADYDTRLPAEPQPSTERKA
jgi:uncharacterized protein YndB with AHSA1/START domain